MTPKYFIFGTGMRGIELIEYGKIIRKHFRWKEI